MSDDGWERCCLFDSERGDIGLIWSIFKTRGTANDENWPVGCLGFETSLHY